jgi:hypothetical protein
VKEKEHEAKKDGSKYLCDQFHEELESVTQPHGRSLLRNTSHQSNKERHTE